MLGSNWSIPMLLCLLVCCVAGEWSWSGRGFWWSRSSKSLSGTFTLLVWRSLRYIYVHGTQQPGQTSAALLTTLGRVHCTRTWCSALVILAEKEAPSMDKNPAPDVLLQHNQLGMKRHNVDTQLAQTTPTSSHNHRRVTGRYFTSTV